MASGIYGAALNNIVRGNVDLDTDTFYVMLTTSGYTEDFDTHDFRNDVTNEVSGTGYAAGGQAVTVTVNAYDTVNNRLEITLGGGLVGQQHDHGAQGRVLQAPRRCLVGRRVDRRERLRQRCRELRRHLHAQLVHLPPAELRSTPCH